MKKINEDVELKDLLKKVDVLKNKKEESQKSNFIYKIMDSYKYRLLINKHEKYLDSIEHNRHKQIKKLKIDDKLEAVKLQEKITGLKETSQIKVNEFISDESFLKRVDRLKWYNWIKKLKRKVKKHVLIVIHRPDNHDLARFFPLEKGHIVDIDGGKHLFNPKHFRYINGQAIIYFYWGNPFAKIINVTDGYTEPTLSVEAFSSVLTSKFVIDAVKGEDSKMGIVWFIVLIILLLITMVIGFLNLASSSNISKALGG